MIKQTVYPVLAIESAVAWPCFALARADELPPPSEKDPDAASPFPAAIEFAEESPPSTAAALEVACPGFILSA